MSTATLASNSSDSRRDEVSSDDNEKISGIALAKIIEEMRVQIDGIRQEFALAHGVPPAVAPREKNDVSLAALAATYAQNDALALHNIFAWSPGAVYGTYGQPDNVTYGPGMLSWIYEYGSAHIEITFSNGVVAAITSRMR